MKHTIQTLKKNLTLAEVEALEKELEHRFMWLTKHRDLNPMVQKELMKMIKEILGK